MAIKIRVFRYITLLTMSVCVFVYIILNVRTFKAKKANIELKMSDMIVADTFKFFKTKELHSINSTKLLTTKEPKKAFIPAPTLIHNKNANPEIIQHVQLRPEEARDQFVNLHSFNFTINSNRCSSGNIFLVMLVHSAPENYKKRSIIRTTYGSVKTHKGRDIVLIFLLAAVTSELLQGSLEEESEIYGDIVQGTFEDSYRALVRKHIMAMHWYIANCKSEFILKLDDDTFLNPFRLIEFLSREKPGEGMWCRTAVGFPPFRDPNSKYYTPVSQYPFKKWPIFCLGFAYITTPVTWNKLYSLSKTTRMMNMDDVYVGLLALRAGVKIVSMKDLLLHCKNEGVGQDLSQLKQKVFFVDELFKCGNRPFAYWKHLVGSKS